MTRSGKPGTTLKSRLHQYFLSHEVVTRSRKKTENFAFLEPVTRQFSSLPIFVDCSEVRENFVYILYAWMEAFPVCKCKSTADRTCDFTPLSECRSLEHNFAINVKWVSRYVLITSWFQSKTSFTAGILLWETKDMTDQWKRDLS